MARLACYPGLAKWGEAELGMVPKDTHSGWQNEIWKEKGKKWKEDQGAICAWRHRGSERWMVRGMKDDNMGAGHVWKCSWTERSIAREQLWRNHPISSYLTFFTCEEGKVIAFTRQNCCKD